MEKEALVKFDYPVEIDGKEVTSLNIRKKKVKDELAASRVSENPVEQEIFLMARLTGTSTKDIEELDTDQYELLLTGLHSLAVKRTVKKTEENK